MNREQLLAAMEAAAKITPKEVPVPGWSGTVFVRALTVEEVEEQTEEAAAMVAAANAEGKPVKDKARLARSACRVICDENGDRILDAKNEADVALLSKQPWEILQGILAASKQFNAATPEGAKEAKNV